MSHRSAWIAVALFTLATAVLYGPVFRDGLRTAVPTLPGPPRLRPVIRADHQWVVWAVGRNARTLATQPHRLFDAEQCFPDERTLTLGEPVIALSLLGIPTWLLTQDPVVTYNAALALRTLAAALAMFWLVASWTGRASAGIAAGLFYAFAGSGVRDIVHPYAFDTTGMVLALLFAERFFARGRWRDAAGLAAAASFQLATSFYPLVASFLVALPFGAFLLVRYRPFVPRPTQIIAVAVAIAGAAALVLGPYVTQHEAGVISRDLTQHFLPWMQHAPGGRAFFGWVGLALASAGLLLPASSSADGPRSGVRWALALAALLVAAVAVGPRAPLDLYGPLADWVPGLDTIRLPRKISSGVHLALCVLAGFGFAGLLRLVERKRDALGVPTAVLGVATCAALIGTTLPDYKSMRVRPKADHIGFHRELSAAGNTGPIYDTPIPGFGDRFVWPGSASYLVLAEFHHRRTSACYGSYPQPHRSELEAIERTLPAPVAVGKLAALGFTTVVVHHSAGGSGPDRRQIRFERASRRPGSHLRQLQTSAGMTAYAIEVSRAR